MSLLECLRSGHSRLIFCPNQITVLIGSALTHRDLGKVKTTVIYWPDRCDVTKLLALGAICIPYSRTACIAYLLKNLMFSRVEALLPHRKLGRLVNWVSHRCCSTALIDDGLDTLREEPRNVDPKQFNQGARFYTFNYDIQLGKWLDRFAVDRVSNFSAMTDSERAPIDLTNIRRVVIESPPLNRSMGEIGHGTEDCLLVKHSNVNKQTIKDFPGPSISGAEVALERSLKDFEGDIVVGESMVAVFALMHECPRYRLTICLARDGVQNLAPLVKLIQSRTFARLKLY